MNTLAEENYLKAIFKLSQITENVSTNQIAAELATKASSVTDMLRKLAEKTFDQLYPLPGCKFNANRRKGGH
jgi:Mn-dependent DtxR family transcriptional regulator